MTRKTIRSVVLVALALLTLALGMPTWAFGGGSHFRFGFSFGPQSGAIWQFGFGHPPVFPHPLYRGFLVLGFPKV